MVSDTTTTSGAAGFVARIRLATAASASRQAMSTSAPTTRYGSWSTSPPWKPARNWTPAGPDAGPASPRRARYRPWTQGPRIRLLGTFAGTMASNPSPRSSRCQAEYRRPAKRAADSIAAYNVLRITNFSGSVRLDDPCTSRLIVVWCSASLCIRHLASADIPPHDGIAAHPSMYPRLQFCGDRRRVAAQQGEQLGVDDHHPARPGQHHAAGPQHPQRLRRPLAGGADRRGEVVLREGQVDHRARRGFGAPALGQFGEQPRHPPEHGEGD